MVVRINDNDAAMAPVDRHAMRPIELKIPAGRSANAHQQRCLTKRPLLQAMNISTHDQQPSMLLIDRNAHVVAMESKLTDERSIISREQVDAMSVGVWNHQVASNSIKYQELRAMESVGIDIWRADRVYD